MASCNLLPHRFTPTYPRGLIRHHPFIRPRPHPPWRGAHKNRPWMRYNGTVLLWLSRCRASIPIQVWLCALYVPSLLIGAVLFYFAQSPFFDQTSNNAVLFNQAQYNQNMFPIIATREAFEGRLKTMSGLEYIVAQEPAEMAPGTGTGVWVIRKQMRRKRAGQEDEVTVHSTYFVMGENIYMAPAVGDVIGSRLVSVFSSPPSHNTNPRSSQYLPPSTNSSPPPPLSRTLHPPSATPICHLLAHAPKPPNRSYPKQAKSQHPYPTPSRAPAPKNHSRSQPTTAPTSPRASLRNPST